MSQQHAAARQIEPLKRKEEKKACFCSLFFPLLCVCVFVCACVRACVRACVCVCCFCFCCYCCCFLGEGTFKHISNNHYHIFRAPHHLWDLSAHEHVIIIIIIMTSWRHETCHNRDLSVSTMISGGWFNVSLTFVIWQHINNNNNNKEDF